MQHLDLDAIFSSPVGRLRFIGRWPAIALLACLVFHASPRNVWAADARTADSPRRPNLILLVTDDQRWDTLGAVGNRIIRTPHLDRLARQGVVFTNAFCTTSICATSRASLLTGQYARHHGIIDFRTPLDEEAFRNAFPDRLRQSGYRTAFIGKWGLGGPLPKHRYDFWHGFSGQGRYFPKDGSGHLTHRMGDAALQFLDTCTPEQPFCLQISFKAAHVQDRDPHPFQPDPRYNDLYVDAVIPRPHSATPEAFAALPEFLRTSEGRVRWQRRFANEAMFQQSVKDYYRLITGVDDVVGRIVSKLQSSGLDRQTVIVFTSDNGFFLGEHGLAGKWFMYEESIRLPLVYYDPRLPKMLRGRRVDAMVLNIDIAPTLLELAGLTPPETMDGQSLVPWVEQRSARQRDDWFYEHRFKHPRIAQSEGVRGRRWKYVRYVEFDPPYEQLFDLQHDPYELNDLARAPQAQDRLQAMRERWKQWCEQLDATGK